MQLLKVSALFLSLAVAACGGSGSSRTTSKTTPVPAANAADPSCPVAVAGTSVTVEDSPSGAALVFVTTGDVSEVRRRTATMASMHNEHHGAMGPLPDGSDAGGGHAGHDMSGHAGHDMSGHADHGGGAHAGHAGGMIGVHSKAAANEIEGGAKLSFTASAGDVAKLQTELRMHAQHLSAGRCAMGAS
jgi:hypothetical protein